MKARILLSAIALVSLALPFVQRALQLPPYAYEPYGHVPGETETYYVDLGSSINGLASVSDLRVVLQVFGLDQNPETDVPLHTFSDLPASVADDHWGEELLTQDSRKDQRIVVDVSVGLPSAEELLRELPQASSVSEFQGRLVFAGTATYPVEATEVTGDYFTEQTREFTDVETRSFVERAAIDRYLAARGHYEQLTRGPLGEIRVLNDELHPTVVAVLCWLVSGGSVLALAVVVLRARRQVVVAELVS
jgi:hypothetical protein